MNHLETILKELYQTDQHFKGLLALQSTLQYIVDQEEAERQHEASKQLYWTPRKGG